MKNNARRWLSGAFIAALLAFGIFIFYRPIVTSGFHYFQTGYGDSVLNNYFLEHSFQQVFNREYRAAAWSPNFFYPAPNVLTYSDNLWGSAPIYWLARACFDPLTAFQWWLIIVSALNFFAFYFLARSLKVNIWFAGLTSFLFAFSLPAMNQLGHPQLLPQFYSVLAVFFILRYFKTKQFYNFVLFELCAYLQLLAGIYLGWFFILAGVPFILCLLASDRKESAYKLFFNYRVAISGIIFIALIIFTFFPYYQSQKYFGPRPFAEVQSMTPSVNSYLSVRPEAIFYQLYPPSIKNAAMGLPMQHEHFMFLGMFFWLLLAASLVGFAILRSREKDKTPWPRLFIISLSVFIFITLISIRIPFTNFSLWIFIYDYLPGAGAIRALTRIWTVSYLFLYLAAAILASAAYDKVKSKAFRIFLIALALLACVEQVYPEPRCFDKVMYQNVLQQLDQAIIKGAQHEQVDAFYLRWSDMETRDISLQVRAMWAGLSQNMPTINGYSGQQPLDYKDFTKLMTNEELTAWLRGRGQLHTPKNILVLEVTLNKGIITVVKSEVLHLSGD